MRPHPRRYRNRARYANVGVTLIEVLVVLAIMAALAAAAAPALTRALDRTRMNAGARALVSALKTARHEARTTGRETLFALDVASQRYGLTEMSHSLVLPEGSTVSFLTAESERLSESAGAIRFFPDGSSTGGTLTLDYRGRERRVEIDWLTGQARMIGP